MRRIIGAIVGALLATSAFAQSIQLGPGQVLGNSTAAQRPGAASNLSAVIDRAFTASSGAMLSRDASAWRVSPSISNPIDSGFPFVFFGDNLANAISRWPGARKPLLFIDQSVNWDQVNYNTIVDFSVLTAQSSTSNQYATLNCATLTANTAFNWNHVVCAEDQFRYVGSGTLTYQSTLLSFPTYNGPVTQRSGVWLLDAAGSGTLGTQYGFRCNQFTKATTNWCLYADGTTPNYIGGSLLLSTNLLAVPSSAKLAISKNAAAAANAPVTNALVYGVNADGSSSVLNLDGYGTGANGGMVTRAARGTAAAPSQTLSGDFLFSLNPYAYNSTGGFGGGSAFGQGIFGMLTTEDCTAAACGTKWVWYGVTTGTNTTTQKMQLGSGLSIGTATDSGVGRVNALNGYDVNGSPLAVGNLAGFGANVATALGIAVGSAGSIVTNGGVLGTPSSGDGSNITNVNAATLGGATFAAPGAIGGGTPAAGTFTALAGNTSVTTPIVKSAAALQFQTNGTTFAGNINTSEQWLIGTTNFTLPTGPQLVLSKNVAASASAPNTNALLYATNADGISTNFGLDAYGAGASAGFIMRAARGTAASPSQSQSGDNLFSFNAYAYNSTGGFAGGSAFGQGLLTMTLTENCAVAACGTKWAFYSVTSGTNTTTQKAQIGAGLSVGTTTDPGVGLINTNSATFMIGSKTSYNNGAGASAGTIANAPSVGNPTKWIPVDDNGTTRYIPAW